MDGWMLEFDMIKYLAKFGCGHTLNFVSDEIIFSSTAFVTFDAL